MTTNTGTPFEDGDTYEEFDKDGNVTKSYTFKTGPYARYDSEWSPLPYKLKEITDFTPEINGDKVITIYEQDGDSSVHAIVAVMTRVGSGTALIYDPDDAEKDPEEINFSFDKKEGLFFRK